jgi:plastocyanin
MQPSFRRACLLACVLVCAATLAACQQHSDSTVVDISILGSHGSNSFKPNDISVNLGTVVTWTNNDTVPHSVTSPGAFDSGMIAPNGGKWRWVAAIQGTFPYYSMNDSSMKGSITVSAQAPQGQAPQGAGNQ